jgi:SOUL heme-binding protein
MNIFLIVAALLVTLFFIVQIYWVMSANKTATQAYKVLVSKDNFEIRFYPAATMASITSSARSYKELGSQGFRKLAGYIFGGNEAGQKIAMTTPVRMDMNDTAASMSFVMPAPYHAGNLPKPNDQQVMIKTVPEEYAAALSFGGFASDHEVAIHTQQLQAALKENNITYVGNFQLLVYNAPYQLLNRRNEIIVQVDWRPVK